MALTFKHNSAVFVSEHDSLKVQPRLAELLTKNLGSKGIKSQLYHEQNHLTCRALASVTESRYLHLCIEGCGLQLLKTITDTPKQLTCWTKTLPVPWESSGGSCVPPSLGLNVPYLRGPESSLPSSAVLTLCLTAQPSMQIPGCYARQKAISLFIHYRHCTVCFLNLEEHLTLTLPLSLPTISWKRF